MSFTGEQLTTPVLQSGYPAYRRERGGDFQKVYVYEVAKEYAKANIPEDYASDPDGEEGYHFLSANTSPSGKPGIVSLTVTYGTSNGSSSSGSLGSKKDVGSVVLEASMSVSERPIETHPSYGNAEFKSYIQTNNIKSYMVANPTYTRTEVRDAKKTQFSEWFITEGIMRQMSPPGISGAIANSWVKVGRDIRSDGNLLEVRDTYAYDDRNWKGVDWGLNNIN